jgi:uncharacterized protein (TIGR03437 family)
MYRMLWGLAFASAGWAAVNIVAVTNAADFQPGLPQKGSLAAIFCTGVERPEGQPQIIRPAEGSPVSNTLGGVNVWINFRPAPVTAVAFLEGYQQINVQVPWEGDREPLYVEVFYQGERAHMEAPQRIGSQFPPLFPSESFSAFFVDGRGYAVIQRSTDWSLVTPENPARPGEQLVAYGINLGPVRNGPASGMRSPFSPLATSHSEFWCSVSDSLFVNGVRAAVSFAGLAPGLIGVYQVNFQMPAAGSGTHQIVLRRSIDFMLFGGPCSRPTNQVFDSRPALIASAS